MKSQIKAIICKYYPTFPNWKELASEEIEKLVFEFVEWLLGNISPNMHFDTIEGVYEYWFENVKNKKS